MKFFELFDPIRKGNFGLTDEAVYKSIKHGGTFLPLYGGTEEHTITDRWVSENGRTKEDEPITKFEGEGIILSLDGSAGSMTYHREGAFALNHHAGFLTVKDGATEKVDSEFFSLFYENQLREASVSEGSKTLTTAILEEMEFDLPRIEGQREIMARVRPILNEREVLRMFLRKAAVLRGCALNANYESYQAKDIPIAKVLTPNGGNSGLTEKEIYQHILEEGERFVVLSSSTEENTRLGEIPKTTIHGEPLKTISDEEGILVIRNGKAGKTFYIEEGSFTLTDHAYFLTQSADCPSEVNLKWLMNQYRHTFLDYTSSSDNATWNMTGFFETVQIDVPSLKEQEAVVAIYDRLEKIEQSVLNVIERIDHLFTKQVVAA